MAWTLAATTAQAVPIVFGEGTGITRNTNRFLEADATLETSIGPVTASELGPERSTPGASISRLQLDFDPLAPVVVHSAFSILLDPIEATADVYAATSNVLNFEAQTDAITILVPEGTIAYSVLDPSGSVRTSDIVSVETRIEYTTPLGALVTETAVVDLTWTVDSANPEVGTGRATLSLAFDFQDFVNTLEGTDPVSGLPLSLLFGAEGVVQSTFTTAVPEPNTFALMMIGLAGLASVRRIS